ncbi:MAG TPA: FAD-dependent thymidylate synthase [Clostridiales bacterium]|nr:FAD-dependent thymidylate synthase [Clostridiales bacterium]
MLKVTLLAYTPNPEQLVATAAKLCYSPATIDELQEGLTPEAVKSFLNRLTEMGHQSPFEHASFTFGIEGVSRTLLAQITRHRIASFSVQSQRYVSERGFDYITPPAIAEDDEALAAFEESMAQAREAYDKLAGLLEERYLSQLTEDTPAARRNAKSKANEDARFVLPGACDTKMIVTMNARSLRNFFGLRCCNRAQWEIRQVANEMLRLCKQVAPLLFVGAGPGCVSGTCPEGAMSCGKMQEMREFYSDMDKGE